MRRVITALPVVALLLAACTSSGGGASNCALNPTLPGCQAGGDAISGDADGSVDSSSCTGNARRCTGQKTQQCINGGWQDLFTCPASQQCQDGFCVGGTGCSCNGKVCGDDGCGNSCGNCSSGSTCQAGACIAAPTCTCGGAVCGLDNCGNSCGACQNGQTCQGGHCSGGTTCSCGGALCGFDNCGNACGTCQSGWTCSGGGCIPDTQPQGTGTCSDILDCVVNTCLDIPDDNQAAACQDACYTAGNPTGQTEFGNYVDCINACGADDFCFADTCPPAQAACFFAGSGPGGCFDILDCFDFCGNNDDNCIVACYEASTTTAQAALLGLNDCLTAACPNATSGDDPCISNAIDGVCAQAVAQCQYN